MGRVQLASITKRKEGTGFNMRLAPGVTLTFDVKNKDGETIGQGTLEDGAYLNLQTPQERVAFLVENDHISEQKGEEILENIPDFVKYEVSVQTETKAKTKSSTKSKSKVTKEDSDF